MMAHHTLNGRKHVWHSLQAQSAGQGSGRRGGGGGMNTLAERSQDMQRKRMSAAGHGSECTSNLQRVPVLMQALHCF